MSDDAGLTPLESLALRRFPGREVADAHARVSRGTLTRISAHGRTSTRTLSRYMDALMPSPSERVAILRQFGLWPAGGGEE